MKINKSKILIVGTSALVFIFSFVVYLTTLAPDVVFGDSADLIMSAHFWGVAHPPGYPLFTILAKLFSLIPLRSIAFRINLFSALLASAAAITSFFVAVATIPEKQKLTIKILPAASASLLFSFSYTFWSHSVITEFVSMEILLLSTLLLLSLKWVENQKNVYIYSFCFVYGLAISHRPTTLFLAPAFLYLIASIEPKIFTKIKVLLICSMFVLGGLLPYLYLPISASRNSLRNWGDVTNFNNFWNHITASEYRGHLQFFPLATISHQITAYVHLLMQQFTPALLIIALLGIYWAVKHRPRILIFLLLLFLFNFAYAVNVYQISELLLYLPGFLILALLIGLGLNFVLENAKNISSPLFFATAFLVAILPFILIGKNFDILKNKNKFFASDYAQNVLNSLEKNALLIFDGDNLFPIEYVHFIEKKRPDAILISKRTLQKDWYLKQLKRTAPSLKVPPRQKTLEATLKKLVIENIKDHPIYLSNISLELLPFFTHKYEGMVFRLQPGKGVLVKKTIHKYFYRLPRSSVKDPDYFTLLGLWQPEINLLSAYLIRKEPEKALTIAKTLYKAFPKSALFSFELAEVYRSMGKYRLALNFYNLSLNQDPLFADSYHSLAAIYLQQRNYLKALDALEKSVVYQPKNPMLRYLLAQIYEKTGREDKAIKNWEILLNLDADSEAKREAREHLRKLTRNSL